MNAVLKLQKMKVSQTSPDEPIGSNISVACKKESTVSFVWCVPNPEVFILKLARVIMIY